MPTLVLSSRYTDDSINLARAAALKGWDVERLIGWRLPERIYHEPVLYLESLFAYTIADQLGIKLIDPAEDWLVKIPGDFVGRTIEIMTAEAAQEALKSLGPLFIKPPNDKSFPAKVYKTLPDYIAPNSKVLVQSVVTWKREFRCFILDKKVQTLSIYWRDGYTAKPDWYSTPAEQYEIIDFAQKLLAEVDVPKAIVMDIGIIDKPAVIELNAAWGSGLAGCDPNKALDVIRESCR